MKYNYIVIWIDPVHNVKQFCRFPTKTRAELYQRWLGIEGASNIKVLPYTLKEAIKNGFKIQ